MASVKEHYENHLAEYYSWISGGTEQKIAENRQFFEEQRIRPHRSGIAVDLGAGSGFQSIPLAEFGFRVLGIDLSPKLLAELKKTAKKLPIEAICDDLMNFTKYCSENLELCVCMGDTLTHLDSHEKVKNLIERVHTALEAQGRFILSFRDLTQELKELERFIPVKSDAHTIFTCFLEYETDHVRVHDIIYELQNKKWALKKSFFRKLRISPEWTKDYLQRIGFNIEVYDIHNGMVYFIARKE